MLTSAKLGRTALGKSDKVNCPEQNVDKELLLFYTSLHSSGEKDDVHVAHVLPTFVKK